MSPCTHSSIVVLPTYNEVENIRSTLQGLMRCDPYLDVLVVDDGSPDGTANVVEKISSEYPDRIEIIQHGPKSGLGAAYRAGFSWAMERRYRVIVQMDADGSHPITSLPEMINLIEAGSADVVVGSRYIHGGGTRNWPLRRKLLSRLANSYARSILAVDQRDLTGGFRAWRGDALAYIDPLSLTTNGYGFLVEMTAAAHRMGLRTMEIPINFVDRLYGCSKMNGGIAVEAALMVWHLRPSRQTVVGAPQAALALAS